MTHFVPSQHSSVPAAGYGAEDDDWTAAQWVQAGVNLVTSPLQTVGYYTARSAASALSESDGKSTSGYYVDPELTYIYSYDAKTGAITIVGAPGRPTTSQAVSPGSAAYEAIMSKVIRRSAPASNSQVLAVRELLGKPASSAPRTPAIVSAPSGGAVPAGISSIVPSWWKSSWFFPAVGVAMVGTVVFLAFYPVKKKTVETK